MCPAGFIETHGPSLTEEQQTIIDAYRELKADVFLTKTVLYGVALLIFVTYEIYHLISKLRGNEKNVRMNNFGIALAVLGVVYYAVGFFDETTYKLVNDKWRKWYDHHWTLYLWIFLFVECAYLLFHWLLNWRYVKSTFRLPVLEKAAEFHSEMADRSLNSAKSNTLSSVRRN